MATFILKTFMTPKFVLESFSALESNQYDGLVLVSTSTSFPSFQTLDKAITRHLSLDHSASSTASLIITPDAPGSRLILSHISSIAGDVDDVRRFYEASRIAIQKCVSVGIKKPLIYIQPLQGVSERILRDFQKHFQVSLLGVLAECYTPLQAREFFQKGFQFQELGIISQDKDSIQQVEAIEQGRILARDVGGSDPERMTPFHCAQYITHAFAKDPCIKVTVITDVDVILKEYPLLHAVARGSLDVTRHFPAIVRLEYHSPEPSQVKENLFLVGKGVTYDTGGADIKYGGVMRGMSRDKCGAAACAGFMKTVSLMKPKHINVIADLGFVRNTSGPDNYVSDEIIVSRAGVRVLIGNTDAEGRMVMGDLLAQAKERALSEKYKSIPSRILTVATLTGHSIRAVGTGYSISLDNGPAREAGISKRLFDSGHLMAEPFETSTLRREDYQFVKAGSVTEDVVQANEKPSTLTSRGHQYPAAFLSVASGISKHGLDSENPICFTHVDIAGSAEEGGNGLSLPMVTGSPIAAFTRAFL